jgi:hypothetical protein
LLNECERTLKVLWTFRQRADLRLSIYLPPKWSRLVKKMAFSTDF